ncbi:MAG: FG-GAP repeat domain-containing protein [bacterium]
MCRYIILLLFLVIPCNAFAEMVSFAPPIEYMGGNSPKSLISKDFNKDGKADLAVVNTYSHDFSIFYAQEDGGFTEANHYKTEDYPTDILAGDFNEDGRADIAIVRSKFDCVSILLGQDDGLFGGAIDYAVGDYPLEGEAIDINGDNCEDIVIVNSNSDDISLLISNKDGTFQEAYHCGVGDYPTSLMRGDFNLDGKEDLAVLNIISRTLSILLAHGDGIFSPALHYPAGDDPQSAVIGDFNQDEKEDCAIANTNSNAILILLGQGDGTFKKGEDIPFDFPKQVRTEDVNNDGKADLAVLDELCWDVTIMLGNGDATFKEASRKPAGIFSSLDMVKDINGDNLPDLLLTNTFSNKITVVINHTPSISIAACDQLMTSESGESASFTISLNTQPSAEVIIGLQSNDITEGTVSPESVTFTVENWDIPQRAVITGIDDDIDDGDITYMVLTGKALSLDPRYNELNPQNLSVINQNDDTARIIVDPAYDHYTDENGGSTLCRIVLSTKPINEGALLFPLIDPTAEVTMSIICSDETEGLVSPATLTFSSLNWDLPQDVVISGVDDEILDGEIGYDLIISVAQSDDAHYRTLETINIHITNFDNEEVQHIETDEKESDECSTEKVGSDEPVTENPPNEEQDGEEEARGVDKDEAGVRIITGERLITSEDGDMVIIEVMINSKPSSEVTISFSSSDESEGNVSPSTLHFTPDDWRDTREVMIKGIDDTRIDGDISYEILIGPVLSKDLDYNGRDIEDICIINQDNDVAGITIAPLNGLTTIENGSKATFTIVLNAQPTADVLLSISTSDRGEGTVAPEYFVFTMNNWNIVQTATITGVDDENVDGDIWYAIITHPALSGDENYHCLDPDDVSVVNADNDIPGIVVNPAEGLATAETKDSAKFTVALTSKPSACVFMRISSTDTSEGIVSPKTLTFTPDNWSSPQTVYIIGVDDDAIDGDIPYSVIIGAALSLDSAYNGFDPKDISVINSDNDTPLENITESAAYGCFIGLL